MNMSRHSSFAQVGLADNDIEKLKKTSKTPTEEARKVQRAKILLLFHEGKAIGFIAEKLDLNRKSVELCIDKFLEAGIDAALNDSCRSGRPVEISDDEKAWIISIACQKATDLGYAQELWTVRKLQQYIQKSCKEVGYSDLHGIAFSTVNTILNEENIKPHKIRYYLEKRDPEFEEKMNDVLVVYKQMELQLETNEDTGIITISYDEKPGIQAIANTAEDLMPSKEHGFIGRDSEYKRLGTVSLLAGMDLYSGEIISLVSDTHKSSDFINFLKLLDEKYDENVKIRIVLDNHSVHSSKETRQYLENRPGRFEFVFTPKHGSWLNLIESFFGKFARTCLRGIRVKSKEELVNRIYQYMAEVNREPVMYRWKYKMNEIQV
jgi:transposase